MSTGRVSGRTRSSSPPKEQKNSQGLAITWMPQMKKMPDGSKKKEWKPYIEVSERIRYFRENYKNHALITEVERLDEDTVMVKAMIVDDKDRLVSTGHASESRTQSFINKTSLVENCETSAVGRALGNFGIGVDGSPVASADEVRSAIEKANSLKMTDKKVNEITRYLYENPEKWKGVQAKLKDYEISDGQRSEINNAISEARAKLTKESRNG